MKKIISVLLAIVLCISIFPTAFCSLVAKASAEYVGTIENGDKKGSWALENGILSVSMQGDIPYNGNAGFFHGSVNGRYIDGTFSTVIFNEGVTSIPSDIFSDGAYWQNGKISTHLTVYLPSSLKKLANLALQKCSTVYCFSRDCSFGTDCLQTGCTLYGYKNSTAEKYAQAHTDINFIVLCEEHVFKEPVYPTCTEEGNITAKICSVCGATLSKGEVVSALGHTFCAMVANEDTLCTEATNDSPAKYYYSCIRCGKLSSDTFEYYDVSPKGEVYNGNTFVFGSYPQSLVSDESLLQFLNNLSVTWLSCGYLKGNGTQGSESSGEFMLYADVEYKGEKYRAVKINAYRPSCSYQEMQFDSSTQKDNGYNLYTTYWFKYEPLEWTILDINRGLVICNQIIDCQSFGSSGDYSTSLIRSWLSETFKNVAFTEEEKSFLIKQALNNSAFTDTYDNVSKYDQAATTDDVFLLSGFEAMTENYFSDNESRIAYATDYSKCQGVPVNDNNSAIWFLRNVWINSANSGVSLDGDCFCYLSPYQNLGIRPAMFCDLSKLLKCEHTYEISSSLAATCTKDGFVTYTCSKCNDSYTDTVKAAHDIVSVPAQAPTCTSVGWAAYQKCNNCDYTTYIEIPKLNHSYTKQVIAPTCTAQGYTMYTCVCGDSYTTDYTEALGHSYVEKVTEPTCMKKGFTTYTCTCGDSYTDNYVPAKGHQEKIDVAIQPTCTDTGLTQGKRCSVCGVVFEAQKEIPATGHTVVIDKAVPASCTSTGLTEGKHCSVCKEILIAQNTVAKTEHTWDAGVVTKKATTTTTGIKTYTCSVCKQQKTETIDVLDIAYGDIDCDGKVTAADARLALRIAVGLEKVTAGTALFIAADVDFDEKITAADARAILRVAVGLEQFSSHKHEWGSWTQIKAPTCTETGTEQKICKLDASHKATRSISALGHKLTKVARVEATTTKEGNIEYYHCSRCGKNFSDASGTKAVTSITIPKVHTHSYTTKVVAPTCTAQGYTLYTCSCGYSYKSNVVAAKGHSFKAATCTTAQKCSVCGATGSSALGHNLSKVARKEPTTTTEGNIEYYHCSRCGLNFSDAKGTKQVTNVTISKKILTEELSSSDIFKLAKKYTVEINVEGNGFTSCGSGFIISSDGKIVTNYHVIEEATKIVVTDYNGNNYACSNIVGYDEDLDIAIIKINASNLSAATLSYTYETGDKVYTLGSSQGLSYTFADGLIANKNRDLSEYGYSQIKYIQTSAPISNGNSGGPLIDRFGNVIGINSMSLTKGQNLNFAIPLSAISKVTKGAMTAQQFYDANNSKTELYYSLAALPYSVGRYWQYGNSDYYTLDYTSSENGIYINYGITYCYTSNLIMIDYMYQNQSAQYSETSTLFIEEDLSMNGFLTIMNQSTQETYRSYFDFDPATYTPNGKAVFTSFEVPSGAGFTQSACGQKVYSDFSKVFDYIEFLFDYYEFDYTLADYGFTYYK